MRMDRDFLYRLIFEAMVEQNVALNRPPLSDEIDSTQKELEQLEKDKQEVQFLSDKMNDVESIRDLAMSEFGKLEGTIEGVSEDLQQMMNALEGISEKIENRLGEL